MGMTCACAGAELREAHGNMAFPFWRRFNVLSVHPDSCKHDFNPTLQLVASFSETHVFVKAYLVTTG